jgi:hypothetical protein
LGICETKSPASVPGFFAYVAADTMMTISPIFHGKPRQPVAKFSFDISQLDWRSRWLQPLRARVEAVASSLPLGAFRRKRLDAPPKQIARFVTARIQLEGR